MTDELAGLAGHETADRITMTQMIFLNDSTQQTDALALYGHDHAHLAARQWANACNEYTRTSRHPNRQIQTTQQWVNVLHHLKQQPSTDRPGLRNQIIQGAHLRAGHIIGAPVPCGTTNCQVARILAGETRCTGCGTHYDHHTMRRCTQCQTILDQTLPVTIVVCADCHKQAERDTRQACPHLQVHTTAADGWGQCTACNQRLPL